jgi:hypothetical protein
MCLVDNLDGQNQPSLQWNGLEIWILSAMLPTLERAARLGFSLWVITAIACLSMEADQGEPRGGGNVG